LGEARAQRPGQGQNRIWFGLPSGAAGLLLLIAIELAPGSASPEPAIRYTPPIGTGPAIAADPAVTFIVSPTVEGLRAAFADAGYNLEEVRSSRKAVPRLRLVMLPRDLPDIRDVRDRKGLFLLLALPLVLEANAHVAVERQRLLYVRDRLARGRHLPQGLKNWLGRLAARYKTPRDRIDLLLRRVDTVPPSLALAQAATESGWGTSRFAVRGNAIFGQWTTGGGRGMVPLERPEGETYKVRSFDRLIDSFSAYLLNLNTHRAYREFRKTRAELRSAGKPLDGAELAGELLAYSEKGEEYVDLLRGIIRRNRLAPLDDVVLGDAVIVFAPGV